MPREVMNFLYNIHITVFDPSLQLSDMVKSVLHDFSHVETEAVSYIDRSNSDRKTIVASCDAGISFGSYIDRDLFSFPIFPVEVDTIKLMKEISTSNSLGIPSAIFGSRQFIINAKRALHSLNITDIKAEEISPLNVRKQVSELSSAGIRHFICEGYLESTVTDLGLSCSAVLPSHDSIRDAVDNCIHVADSRLAVVKSLESHKKLLSGQSCSLLAIDSCGNILFTNHIGFPVDTASLKEKLLNTYKAGGKNRKILIGQDYYNVSVWPSTFNNYTYTIYVLAKTRHVHAKTRRKSADISEIAFDELAWKSNCDHFLNSTCKVFQSIIKNVDVYSKTETPVLIQGQVGTEKASIARYLHMNCKYRNHPFLHIHCNLLTPKIWYSFLVSTISPEYYNCTLFFNNVHRLSLAMQNELAAYIMDTQSREEHMFISSTYLDLKSLVSSGAFSLELYKLLSGMVINLPPLSKRKEDLPGIVNTYIFNMNKQFGKNITQVDDEAMEMIKNTDWNLNLNQLYRFLVQVVIDCEGDTITSKDISSAFSQSEVTNYESNNLLPIDISLPLDSIEKNIINHILVEENMNQTAAAKRLGISRSTLWRKLKEY